ncbi:DUF885 family protein [Erythrobacter arachoides]|uniref:DUF885 family protein n=1 Tax=Aurantiacibacter arachoides TaxID=1850444 RepID=A0A845A3X2_9SPHN|nr:DUF885 family protein [Aurantiacibacter arachoides]MXO92299.1 DUF885 family protein [Aurantiacibacter arachoides]GGD58237.1 hypothetical protein GCM10011411_17920 [Aurantiacibacter arachoides]
MKIAPSFSAALSALLLATVAAPPIAAQEAGASDAALQALYGEYYDWTLERAGYYETASGEIEQGPTLSDQSAAARETNAAAAAAFLARLDAIDTAALSPTERVNAAVLRAVLAEGIGDATYREWEMPFDSDSNFWTYLDAPSGLDTVREYEDYLARMRQVPRYLEQNVANARTGLARGFSVPRATLAGRDESVRPYTQLEGNPFLAAFDQMPQRIPEAERARLRAEAQAVIAQDIVPAYTALLAFLRDDYFPAARETLAAEAMPDGAAYYAQNIRQYTTLDMGAEAIHAVGLAEVARIEAAMQAIMDEVGFSGSIAEFNEALRSDPRFVAATPDELMGVAAYVQVRVDGEIERYFGFLPRARFSIRPVPDAIAPFYTAGRGGEDYCQINTHDLPSRPVYNIPALTLHECSPGHSFQANFQREVTGELPAFRRNLYFSGMGEGWGLYTEFLGEEMGIYRTPYERYGRLSYEMWRAARLVIDTGIHHYGWTREQAVDYLAGRTALSRHEVGTEVDRYISWPGQALAYKLGEMTIRRLRGEAEAALGDAFDIRKFHDVVLALGSVPLPVLEERIAGFIADGGQGLADVTYD